MRSSKYAWYVLGIGFLINLCVSGVTVASIPVLFKEISLELGLDLVQLGSLWGAFSIGQACVLLPGGLIGDRLGIRIVVFLGCLIATVASIGRGLSHSFIILAVFTFLSAPALSFIQPNLIKAMSAWFEPRRFGLAGGITLAGFALGGAVGSLITATVLSPLLGGWRNVMFLYAAVAILLGIIWFFTIKEHGQGEGNKEVVRERIPFKEAFLKVIHIKDVWLMAIAFTGLMSCALAPLGYMPVYFENIGMEETLAHTLYSINFLAAAIGNILVPAISDRVGLRKAVYMVSIITAGVCVFLIPLVTSVPLWIVVIGMGIAGAGTFSISSVMTVEIRGVGSTYAGTALGVVLTIANLIAFTFPIIGGALAKGDPGLPFMLWAFIPIMSIITVIFIKETGYRATALAADDVTPVHHD